MENKEYRNSNQEFNIGDILYEEDRAYVIKYKYRSKCGFLYEVERVKIDVTEEVKELDSELLERIMQKTKDFYLEKESSN